MPAPLSSSPAPPQAPESGNSSGRKPHVNRKTRIVRRRGRAKNTIESDDDIEREVGTDSDSDSDQSSLDSDLDVESGSQRVLPNGHSHLSTPSTTQSPEGRTPLNVSPKRGASVTVEESFFSPTRNWSEMVADENDNGPADLPVIDFADFDQHGIDQRPPSTTRSRKRSKGVKKPPVGRTASEVTSTTIASVPSSTVGDHHEPESNGLLASSSRQPSGFTPRREPGQSARQAYQKRLDSDPSYVPTVGEFWGHDDRLLDKDLRSLSNWWRGRWQGRGRGRGFYRGFPARGRGRAMPTGHQGLVHPLQDNPEGSGGEEEVQPGLLSDVAPIEQTWTHDGFEEMKRKDERRRTQEQPQAQAGAFRGMGGFRGGRALNRGRGGFSRGAFTPSPTRPRPGLPFVPSPGKIWFAMKPERMWTKHHEAFLYFDSALKPRRGQGPAFRVKIPGERVQIVKAPFKASSPSPAALAKPSTASVLGSEDGEKTFVVRIPKRDSREVPQQPPPAEESIRTVEEPPIDDAFIVRPRAMETSASYSARTLGVNGALAKPTVQPGVPSSPPNQENPVSPSSLPDQKAQQQLEQLSLAPSTSDSANSLRWTQTEEAVMRNPSTETRTDNQEETANAQPRPTHTVLPPLQTVFTPVSQNSPSYGPHYAYGPALPPGIAMNQHGMPYELATGRAVYLQPPPAMYNPRPVMQTHLPPNMPFVPNHMHHHSAVSPDFLSQPPSHTPPANGFIDPSSGSPIFSLPRSSRIEIRAPSDQQDGKTSNKSFVRRPSGLRSNTSGSSEPSGSTGDASGQSYFLDATGTVPFASVAEPGRREEDHEAQQHSMDAAIMSYPMYQHQYFYPEAYGYPSYVDMSQVTPYEMYPADPRAPPQAVYY